MSRKAKRGFSATKSQIPGSHQERDFSPKCSICDEFSTGIHFGVESCAACSAFFRRTIVLEKTYKCLNKGLCNLEKRLSRGQLCRACRLNRCLYVGMDKTAVQHRRDAIGQYSRQYEAIKMRQSCSSSGRSEPTSPSLSVDSPAAHNQLESVKENILDGICSAYKLYQKRRKTFYCNDSLVSLFDDSKDLEVTEITDFRDVVFQILRIEPRLCVEFINSLDSLKQIPSEQKATIYSNFILKLQAIEEPYLTWKHGGLADGGKFWMMQNKSYIMFNRVSAYFQNDVMRGLNLDEISAKRIFIPSFKHALELVGQKMALLNLAEKELCALIGIVLFDPNVPQLTTQSQRSLQSLRNQLFFNLMDFERSNASIDEAPEIRFGNMILSILPGIEVHAQFTRQNMHLLRFFDVVPRRDELFDQITGVNGSAPNLL